MVEVPSTLGTPTTRGTIKIQPDTRQLKGLFTALREMDKDSQTALRNDVTAISQWAATQFKHEASTAVMPRQAEKVVRSIRANRDRVPNITIGGSREKFSGGANSGIILFGNEFGALNGFANGGRRFPYPKKQGNWIFPTLKVLQPDITHMWKNAVDKVLDNWKKGAGGNG